MATSIGARSIVNPELQPAAEGLLSLPADRFAESFGTDDATPGSGSSNAYIASVAAQLVIAVAKRTLRTPANRPMHRDAEIILKAMTRSYATLLPMVETDSQLFKPVIDIRRARAGAEGRLREQYLRAEIDALKPATELPLSVAEEAISIAKAALHLLKFGFKPSTGDSFAALDSVLAAAGGSLYVARKNTLDVITKAVAVASDGEHLEWCLAQHARSEAIASNLRSLRRERARASAAMERAVGESVQRLRPQRRKSRSQR